MLEKTSDAGPDEASLLDDSHRAKRTIDLAKTHIRGKFGSSTQVISERISAASRACPWARGRRRTIRSGTEFGGPRLRWPVDTSQRGDTRRATLRISRASQYRAGQQLSAPTRSAVHAFVQRIDSKELHMDMHISHNSRRHGIAAEPGLAAGAALTAGFLSAAVAHPTAVAGTGTVRAGGSGNPPPATRPSALSAIGFARKENR